jgi:hypothetical protein
LEDAAEEVVPNNKAVEEEEGKVETHSAIGDTESSRTLEAGDDAFDPTSNADADADGQSLLYNNEDLEDHVDIEHPAGDIDETGNSDEFNRIGAESADMDGLNRNSQDFRRVLQPAKYSVHTTATGDHDTEFDQDDLLDDHGAHEGHDSLGKAAALDFINNTVGHDATAQADGYDDLSEVHRSNEIPETAGVARTAVHGDDNVLLEDGDSYTTAQEVTSSVTPSRSRASKRKSRDDEDEFGLLESGTPDGKRRRPS